MLAPLGFAESDVAVRGEEVPTNFGSFFRALQNAKRGRRSTKKKKTKVSAFNAELQRKLGIFMKSINRFKELQQLQRSLERRVTRVENDAAGLTAGERVLSMGQEAIMEAVTKINDKCKLRQKPSLSLSRSLSFFL